MNQTLIVIDLQNCFVGHYLTSYSNVIKNAAIEVKAAINRNDDILFVEYVVMSSSVPKDILYRDIPNEYYPTVSDLTNLTSNYNKTTFVFKRSVDGGTEVVQTLREKSIHLNNIRVCGAYTSACVSETVQTMALKLKNSEITLVEPALASYYGEKLNQQAAISYMLSIDNVRLDRNVSLLS